MSFFVQSRNSSKPLCSAFCILFLALSSASSDSLTINYHIDIPLTVSTAAVSGAIGLIRFERLAPAETIPPPRIINAVDQSLAGRYNPQAAHISDYTLAGALALPLALLAAGDCAFVRRPTNLLLYLESLSINQFFVQITKTAVSRPRPLVYAPDIAPNQRRNADNYLSFYSGHTASAFAGATAATLLASYADASAPLVATIAGAGYSLALLTSAMRLVSGNHFYTDVLAGAIMGTAVPLITINAHRQQPGEQAWADAPASRSIALRILQAAW